MGCIEGTIEKDYENREVSSSVKQNQAPGLLLNLSNCKYN